MWVFGYGSLLWNPGFAPAETRRARLTGFRRSFSMLSIHHRGSEAEPGLVLALEEMPGETCTGMAFRAAPDEADAVLAMLRDRELISSAYVERHVELVCDDGALVDALAYVIEPDHVQYVQLPLEEQAQRIAFAVGGRGPNSEYLFNTVGHLGEIGVRDADLEWLDLRVRALLTEDEVRRG